MHRTKWIRDLNVTNFFLKVLEENMDAFLFNLNIKERLCNHNIKSGKLKE